MKSPSTVGVQKNGPRLIFAVRSRISVDDVVGVLGRRREPRVLEAVDAGRSAAPDLFGTMRVRDDRQPRLCASSTTALHLVDRHLILIDQLDDVDAGLGELAHFRARVVGPFTPQRNDSVPGYGSCWMNGPET